MTYKESHTFGCINMTNMTVYGPKESRGWRMTIITFPLSAGHSNFTQMPSAVFNNLGLCSILRLNGFYSWGITIQCCPILGYSKRQDMKLCLVQLAVPNPQKDKK